MILTQSFYVLRFPFRYLVFFLSLPSAFAPTKVWESWQSPPHNPANLLLLLRQETSLGFPQFDDDEGKEMLTILHLIS